MTTATMPPLAPALQELVNVRLDMIDRLLLDRVPRPDRVSIVMEVEAQIFELLTERGADDLTRDDVLTVLSRLDPPEAYLPEQSARHTSAPGGDNRRAPTRTARCASATEPRIGIAGGIVGVSALATILVMPLIYLFAGLLESEELMILGLLLAAGLMGLAGLLGLVFSLSARLRGTWSVVGSITGALALLLSFSGGMFFLVNL